MAILKALSFSVKTLAVLALSISLGTSGSVVASCEPNPSSSAHLIDTDVPDPCSCRSGYSCDCGTRSPPRPAKKKRKYTWSREQIEKRDARKRTADSPEDLGLIQRRKDRDSVRVHLAASASLTRPCCKGHCMNRLYTECGEALVDAVLHRAHSIYVGNQNRSFDRLRDALRTGFDPSSGTFEFSFDHGGFLRRFHDGLVWTCARAWELLHQVSKKRRLLIQSSLIEKGPGFVQQRKAYELKHESPREHARAFLNHFFSDAEGNCEIMPFHDGLSETFKRHLPTWMTKKTVYGYYTATTEAELALLPAGFESRAHQI